MLIVPLNVFAQSFAAFTADKTEGCAPLVVKFTDQSTGGATSWLWNLGNGITSTEKNPGTIYFAAGSYTVTLRVVTAGGTSEVTKKDLIIVRSAPVISFNSSATSGCFPLDVSFNSQAQPVSGTIKTIEWDFGDGTFASQPMVSHTYQVAGTFTISIKATNSFGCVSVLNKPALVRVFEGVKAGFSLTSGLSCNPPVVVQFTNSSVGGNITSHRWDFGDGTFSSLQNNQHTYVAPGSYTVKLAVANNFGCTDTITKQNAVNVGAVNASFNSADSTCRFAPVTFANTSSPAPQTVLWNFGDGTTSAQQNPTKTYNTAGIFTVRLTSFFGGCTSTTTKKITVVQAPAATFTNSSPTASCLGLLPVNFLANNSSTAQYLWNFGDGATSTERAPTHVFTGVGSFSVSLQVALSNGCTNIFIKKDLVYLGPPIINGFKNLPVRGCGPRQVAFEADISTSEPITTYLWNFGDSTTSDNAMPQHTYNNTGRYAVTLKVTTTNGCTASYSLPDAVIVSERPTAGFSAAPRENCAFDKVIFTDESTGEISNWTWNFGDGSTSTEQNPGHNYQDTGFFGITLIVSNFDCTDTITFTNYVYIKPPIARFATLPDCTAPFTRQFTDSSIGATSWAWNFGDGTTSTEKNPAHNFLATGLFNVNLTVTNGSCKSMMDKPVYIISDTLVISVSPKTICTNTSAIFIVSNITASGIVQYTWNFGDGSDTVTTTVPTANHAYALSGRYSPTLTTLNVNGCFNTVRSAVEVSLNGPVAGFTLPAQACANSIVTIADASQSNGNVPIQQWIWIYGDGKTDSARQAATFHVYKAIGQYTVQLTVVDSQGCANTITKPAIIKVTAPKALFTSKDSVNCTLKQVSFTSQSQGEGLTYLWHLGDGATATTANVQYRYSQQGLYTIGLKVTDRFGCTDTAILANAVKVSNAKAAFSASDSAGSCPPFILTVNNLSTDYTSLLWDFGDSSFSNLPNPSHYYNLPGTYRVVLTARGYGNCRDSIFKSVIVSGPSGSFTYGPKQICAPGRSVFKASAKNRSSFIWDFGDGTTLATADSVVSHVYLNDGWYLPKLILLDAAGCQVPLEVSDTITIAKTLAEIKNIPAVFCDSAMVQFVNNSKATFDTITRFRWSFGDGTIDTINQNPIHTYRVQGAYQVTLSAFSARGCVSADTLVNAVVITPSPTISIVGNKSVCQQLPLQLTAGSAPGDTATLAWKWDFGNGLIFTEQQPAPVRYFSAGTYLVQLAATNFAGCTTVTAWPVLVNPTPAVNAGIDTVICRGSGISLIVTGADTYTWRPAGTLTCTDCATPFARPLTDTRYSVLGTTQFGCIKNDSVWVRVVQPFTIATSGNDTLCVGQSTRLTASGADLYQWWPQAGIKEANIASPVAAPTTTTTYQVIATDYKNCFADTGEVRITVYPIPVFNIVESAIAIKGGESAVLKTTNSADITRWRWQPFMGLSCSNCPQPVAAPQLTTTYRVQVLNNGGCKAEDEIRVTVLCNNANIYIPNTFSPNGDGMNDVFFVRGKGIATIKTMTIFNRWGAVVFRANNVDINDQSAGWRGTFNNTALGQDVFVYQVDVVCENNSLITLKGDVTLLK